MVEIASIGRKLEEVDEGDLIRWNGWKNPQPVISSNDSPEVDFEVESWRGSRFRFFLDNGEPTMRNLQSGKTYTIDEFERVGRLYEESRVNL